MRYYLIAFLLLLLQSCLDKDKIPANVLSKNKMQAVLWDLLRVDEYINDTAVKDTTLNKKEKSIELYEKVFSIHNISKNDFQKSLDYYQARPDLLKVILDSITSQQRQIMEKQYNSRPDTVKNQLNPVE